MKDGGLLLWNAIAVREMSKTSWQTGKLRMKDDLENQRPSDSFNRFGRRKGSLRSFTLTIPCNLAKPVKIFPGIIVRRHHTDRKHMGLLREQCVE